jgi:MSHA biogenesis protein MshG
MSLSVYRCESRDPKSGELRKTEVVALSKEDVFNESVASGLIPIHVDMLALKTLSLRFQAGGKTQLSHSSLAIFFRQLSSLLAAGLPITQSLLNLQKTSSEPTINFICRRLVQSLSNGESISSAMSMEPVFDSLCINMVKVGESTGRLDTIFSQLSEHYEYEQHNKRAIKQSTRYPFFVILALLVAIVILSMVVFPQFTSLFKSQKAELPALTVGLMYFSELLLSFWWVAVCVFFVAAVVFKKYINTPKGRYKYDYLLLKIPVVGELIYQSVVVKWSKNMSMMVDAGIPLSSSLKLTNHAINNTYLSSKLSLASKDINNGYPLSEAIDKTGAMPMLCVQMISIAEQSGDLAKLLSEVAKYYQSEVDYAIKGLTAKIEPLLTVGLGVVVLVFALGIFLPIWGMLDFV